MQITARQVHHMKTQDVIAVALEACKGVDAIYLTFDIDVLDPAFAPGSGANEPGWTNANPMF